MFIMFDSWGLILGGQQRSRARGGKRGPPQNPQLFDDTSTQPMAYSQPAPGL